MVKYFGGMMNSDNADLTYDYLNKGALEHLGSTLYSSNSSTIKEALWGFSNINANYTEDHKF